MMDTIIDIILKIGIIVQLVLNLLTLFKKIKKYLNERGKIKIDTINKDNSIPLWFIFGNIFLILIPLSVVIYGIFFYDKPMDTGDLITFIMAAISVFLFILIKLLLFIERRKERTLTANIIQEPGKSK